MHLTDDQVQDLLRLAYQHAAENSDDPSTQVGALILVPGCSPVFGANKFVHSSFNVPENLQRPAKYQYVEHAERAAIFEAARLGYELDYAVLICPWAACTICARAIVLSGIKQVYAHQDIFYMTPDRWLEEIEIGVKILEASGVEYIRYSGTIGGCKTLFNGEIWYP